MFSSNKCDFENFIEEREGRVTDLSLLERFKRGAQDADR